MFWLPATVSLPEYLLLVLPVKVTVDRLFSVLVVPAAFWDCTP
ncbi:MAG: hypothetical protein U0411_07780 [Thermodesulfovibrionales bacterium]